MTRYERHITRAQMNDPHRRERFRHRLMNRMAVFGYGVSDIALRMDLDESTVRNWLSDRSTPWGMNLRRLAELLRVTPDYLSGVEIEW